MMTCFPGSPVDGFGLEEVGSCSGIAEGADAVAEGGDLPRNFEVFHEREMVFVQFGDRPAGAGDNDQEIGRVGVAIGREALGGLDADGQRDGFGQAVGDCFYRLGRG